MASLGRRWNEQPTPGVLQVGAVSALCSLQQTSKSRLERLNHRAEASGRGQGARERTLKTSMNRGIVGCLHGEGLGELGGEQGILGVGVHDGLTYVPPPQFVH